MQRLIGALSVIGLAAMLVFVPAPASACSCEAPTPEGLMESADVVFVGSPTRLILEADGPYGTERLWEFDVHRVYAGEVVQGLAVSGGSGGDGGCEIAFDEEYGRVAVAARWTSGHLRTGLCSVMSASDFVAAMGPGKTLPAAGDAEDVLTSTSGPPAALVGLAVVALALALAGVVAILVGRRRSVARSETDR